MAGLPTVSPALAAAAQESGEASSAVISYAPDFFSHARPQNALDMVQRVPGFSIASIGAVRGFTGSVGNVLIDGKQPATKSEALSDILTRIQAASVARIDLIRGGAPGIDMGGRPVVVNVILRQAGGLKQTASANAWMFPDGRFLPGLRYDVSRKVADDRSFELTFDSNGSYTDAWGDARRVRQTPGGEVVQDVPLDIVGDGRSSAARGNVTHPLFGGTVKVNGNLTRQLFADRQVIGMAAGQDEFTGAVRATNGELGVNYDRILSDKLKAQFLILQRLGTGVARSEANLAQGFQTEFRRRERDGESIARVGLTYGASPALELQGGAEVAYNFLHGRTAYEENGLPIDLPLSDAKVEELRGELSAQANWKPSSRLSVEAGGRLEVSRISVEGDAAQSKVLTYPKPRVQLAWSPGGGRQLRLRLERVVGQLSFSDFVASAQFSDDRVFAGNGDLEPQSEWVIEAAAEQRFWGRGALTLALRHRRLTNVLDFIAVNEEFEAIGNIGSGSAQEAVATLTSPLDKLRLRNVTLRANGTWRGSKVRDPLTGERRRISGQRPFEGSIGFTHDLAEGKFTYGFDANAGWQERYWRLRELTDTSLTHWFRFFAEYKPSAAWSVRAEYVNLDEYRRQRLLFSGLREKSALAIIEDRVIPPPPRFSLRVRRTL